MLKIEERNNNSILSSSTTTMPEVCCHHPNSKQNDEEVIKNGFKFTTVLESETNALAHQISGHNRTGVLKHLKLGYVLKPLQKEPLGTREVTFYTKVYEEDGNDKNKKNHYSLLRQLVPNFHGLVRIKSFEPQTGNSTWNYYIALEDLVQGFSKTCLIDIKIGAQTWDHTASPVKISHEKTKYVGTKGPLGLSLTGMQYYDLRKGETIKMEKEYGKTLVESSFIGCINQFLNDAYNPDIPKLVAKRLIPKLEKVQKCFEVQRDFCFYASSILIGYDAEKCLSSLLGGEDDSSWLRICMIDFAHAIPMEGDDNPGPDTNYQFGLSHLI